MTAIERLDKLVNTSLDKVRNKEVANIANALIPALPEVIVVLRQLITSSESTPSARLTAVNMLLTMWARCLKTELQQSRAEISREKFKAKREHSAALKAKASVEGKRAALAIHAEKKKIARTVRKAETVIAAAKERHNNGINQATAQ